MSDGLGTSIARAVAAMLTWSTDHLLPSDRFAIWREERAKKTFGVSLELERDKRPGFSGRMMSRTIGSATALDLQASAYHLSRTPSDVARSPGRAFCIALQMRGGGILSAGGRDFVVAAGDFVTGQSDLPYENIPAPQPGFSCRLVNVPMERVAALGLRADDLFLRPIPASPGLPALFASYLTAFFEQMPFLSDIAAEAALDTLVRLAFMARSVETGIAEPGRDAIRIGLLERARSVIERGLSRPDLSPATIAAALGISVRTLHLLFEPTGTSVSRYILARRLEQARLAVVGTPTASITQIAYGCGFDSLPTFFRCFKKAHGVSPRALQASIRSACPA